MVEPEDDDGSMQHSQEASANILCEEEPYEDEEEEGEQEEEDEDGESRSSSHNQYSDGGENDSENELLSGRADDAYGEESEAPSSAIRRPDHP